MAGRPRTLLRKLVAIEEVVKSARTDLFALMPPHLHDHSPASDLDRDWGAALNAVWKARITVGLLVKRLREHHKLPPVVCDEIDGYAEALAARAAGDDDDEAAEAGNIEVEQGDAEADE
jgi:hypothetical protein